MGHKAPVKMGQNTDSVMELSLTAIVSHFYNLVIFYIETLQDFLNEQGVPPSYLLCFTLGICSTLVVTALATFLKKRQTSKNRKYLGIGKIRYARKDIIGGGWTGSTVYQGLYETKDAAIKVIKLGPARDYQNLKEKFSVKDPKASGAKETQEETTLSRKRIMREVSINQAVSLNNDFIVQYHGQEVLKYNKTVYLLIALELCKANLQHLVDDPNDFKPFDTRTILHQLGEALYFLHESGYVHRDLKPSNVLIKKFSHPEQWRIKVADFGATKTARFIHGRGCYSISGDYGSGGWMAPEVMRDVKQREGHSSGDIFSMGLIFYFVVTKGSKLYESQEDIQRNQPTSSSQTIKRFPLETDLINMMTDRDETKRLTAAEVRKHPALWDSEKILNFTATVNELLKELDVPELEDDHRCFPVTWEQVISPAVRLVMINRRYNFKSVRSLIHGIRNYGAHYSKQPRTVRREFGNYPDGYIKYWSKRFPNLFLHTYKIMQPYQRKDETLKKFY